MRGERGQVTIFVAIGLVILFIVAIYFLVVDAEQRVQQEYEQGQNVIEGSQTAELGGAIGSCIDTVVHEELRILGRTGGLHTEDQAYPRAVVDSGVTASVVAYGLTRNRDDGSPGSKKPVRRTMPEYPETGFTIENQERQLPDEHPFAAWQTGYFGDVHFAPVCDKEGPNSPTSTRACRSYPGIPPSVPIAKSTQERLQDVLLQKLQACADPDRLSESLGIEVEGADSPTLSVAFTHANVIVSVVYPLTLVGESQSKIQEIRRTYNVRYMPIAQFARDLALEESRSVEFDPAENYQDLPSWKPGFSVATKHVRVTPETTLNPPLLENTTVVTIIDSKSKIDGDTYGFNFLIEHREPTLVDFPLGCDTAKDEPLANILSADTRGFDPDGIGVEFAWCHQKYADCPSSDMTLIVWDDSLIETEWQDWTDWYTVPGGCPVDS